MWPDRNAITALTSERKYIKTEISHSDSLSGGLAIKPIMLFGILYRCVALLLLEINLGDYLFLEKN